MTMKRLLLILLTVLLTASLAYAQCDTTNHPHFDVDDFLFDTESLDDEEVDMSGYITDAVRSSNDVFSSNAAVSFNIAYFRNRGLDSRYQSISMNGLKMENLVLGRASNTQWGGLSRIFHSADCALNLDASPFAFGGFGGASDYNLCASSFRKQKNACYLVGNGNYNHRLMLTYASGQLKNGWMVALVSARFGTQMSYVEGVTYRGRAYFLAFEKQFNQRHSLNFATWGSPIRQGMQINCVPEVYNLVGSHYYNPNWGWYDGHRRNARNRDTYEPVAMLTHNYNSENKRFELTTSLGATFGHKNTTAFAFSKVPDPHPDYFRYLPSYFMDDEDEFKWCVEQWQINEDYRQIDWDAFVAANEASTAEGGPSVYIIENRVSRHFQLAGTSILNYRLNDNLLLCAGFDVRGYRQHNYKEVDDLLGGEYWLGKDKYADTLLNDPLLAYYDIDHAEAHLTTGDRFGYDYVFHVYRQNLWTSLLGSYRHLDFHVGASVTATELWRTGYMRYGAYRNEAFGDSEKRLLPNYGVKAGVTYKIDAHNALSVNAQWQTLAPTATAAFVNALYSNRYIDHLVSEKNLGADFSYTAVYKALKLRASVYCLQFTDGMEHRNFYHDKYGCFVSYTLTGVDSRHIGAELGAEMPIGKMFSIVTAGHWGDFFYTNRPQAFITANNGYSVLEKGQKEITKTIYWKNYHVAGTPQIVATLGLKFNHKDWVVKVNANYFDKIYAAMNSERRTSDARGFLSEDSEQLSAILYQERVKPQFTLDASVSKSWKIKRDVLGLSLKVTNITNNRNLVTSLSEQHRFDYSAHTAIAFPNKSYYAQGITFALGINYSF